MIGVSPAFILSLYGPGFTTGNFCEGLKLVGELGFSAYQPEILVETALPEWKAGARSVHRTAERSRPRPDSICGSFYAGTVLESGKVKSPERHR